MTEPIFVDTNVLVYARDASEPQKQPIATAWLESLWGSRRGRLSMQVLHEFYVTVTGKLRPGMERRAARADVRSLLTWRPIVLDAHLMERAWMAQDRRQLSWWDSLILAAAQVSGCGYLLSEDFQDGRDLDGVMVIDPFTHDPHGFG